MDKLEKTIKTVVEMESFFHPNDELSNLLQEYQSGEELDMADLEMVSAARHLPYSDFLNMVKGQRKKDPFETDI